ncbi:MAG: redoxin domain-containing protein [Myxococcota bacterium]
MGTMRNWKVGVAWLAIACSGGDSSVDGFVPTGEDRDGDGLTDVEEAYLGSNPDAVDTDRDGWDDRVEVESYTDPLDGFDHPYTGGWAIDRCRHDLVPSGGNAAGDVALNFSLTDQHGDPVRLHDFCGRAIIVASAAQWCEPCRQEARFLQSMFEQYAHEGLIVVTLMGEDVDRRPPSQAVLQDWADEFDLTHPVLQDTSFGATSFYSGSGGNLPLNHLLRPGAVVQRKNLVEVTRQDVLDLLAID